MFKLELENSEKPEINLPKSVGSWIKQESSRKISTSVSLTVIHLTMWITTNYGKFFKRWKPDHLPASWEIYMQVKKQQLELDMKQQTGSK